MVVGSKILSNLIMLNVPSGPHSKSKMAEESKPIQHFLVPEHIKLDEAEKNKLLEQYNISLKQLPGILINDPSIKSLGAKAGDVILIKRKSQTAKETEFFRVVLNG